MAGQDYPVYLGPGQTKTLQVSGDFIYCKFVDRPVLAWVEDQRVKMEAGDNYRPGQRFASFTVENPDRKNPVSIVLTAGKGSFTRQIVQGEIKAEPILRSADGTTRPDTRTTLAIDLVPQSLETTAHETGDRVTAGKAPTWPDGEPANNEGSKVCRGYMDRLALMVARGGFTDGDAQTMVVEYDSALQIAGKKVFDGVRGTSYDAFTYKPGTGYLIGEVDGDKFQIYKLVNGDSAEKNSGRINIGTFANDATQTFLWVPEKSRYVTQGTDGIWEETENFERERQIVSGDVAAAFGYPIGWDAGKGHLLEGDTEGWRRFDWDSGEDKGFVQISRDYAEAAVYGGFSVDGLVIYSQTFEWEYADPATRFEPEKLAGVDFTSKPEFAARRPGCELQSAMVNAGTLPQITADIETETEREGVILRGELIRAALEYYFRQVVADDYLDHVYSFQVTRDALGSPGMPVVAGNQTFARAEIGDDYDMLTPGRVTLTIDNALTTTRPL